MTTQITVRREKGKIWSHIRQKWLNETPEESVRQEFLCVLVSEYGFALDQMDEELEVTGRGSGHARADFVIWRTAKDKTDSKNPLIIVECKSDNVTIKADDYGQGDNYSRLAGARFFVTHNSRETKFWRVVHEKMRGCKNFCVNGHLAGNCRPRGRSCNDRKQRIAGQPTG